MTIGISQALSRNGYSPPAEPLIEANPLVFHTLESLLIADVKLSNNGGLGRCPYVEKHMASLNSNVESKPRLGC